jgi:hypothetical protein
MARRPIEQPRSEFVLKFSYQDAQSRWRDEHRLGSAREVAKLRNQKEGSELARREFHS